MAKGNYNPSIEEMLERNRKSIDALLDKGHINPLEHEYLVNNEESIIDKMNALNEIDGQMDYNNVLVLIITTYLRHFNEMKV